MHAKPDNGSMRSRGAVFALVLLACSAGLVGSAQGAKICSGSMIVGQAASGARLSAVKTEAEQNWRRRVAASEGPSWSHWSVARSRSLDCRKLNGNGRQCQARGYPCKKTRPGGKPSAAGPYKLVR